MKSPLVSHIISVYLPTSTHVVSISLSQSATVACRHVMLQMASPNALLSVRHTPQRFQLPTHFVAFCSLLCNPARLERMDPANKIVMLHTNAFLGQIVSYIVDGPLFGTQNADRSRVPLPFKLRKGLEPPNFPGHSLRLMEADMRHVWTADPLGCSEFCASLAAQMHRCACKPGDRHSTVLFSTLVKGFYFSCRCHLTMARFHS
jgi:hypothetical protein